MRSDRSAAGFTLIEVLAALAILAWALGGAIYMVHQYADQRAHMTNKLFASQVAWNGLMENYRHAEGWLSNSERGGKPRRGTQSQHGRDWRWKVTIKPALGEDLFRYQADVGLADSDRISSSLSLYIVEEQ
ncbi:MAG: type II secretion system protein GspI [Porticoccaceae bacterium]